VAGPTTPATRRRPSSCQQPRPHGHQRVATYRGNVYSGGFSVTGGSADVLNVEEAVLINAPSTGLWTVRVSAPAVPIGPQPFGLVVTGGVGQTAGSLALDRAEYGSTSSVALEVVDTNARQSRQRHRHLAHRARGRDRGAGRGERRVDRDAAAHRGEPGPGDGLLSVSAGDAITATYTDAAPARERGGAGHRVVRHAVITTCAPRRRGRRHAGDVEHVHQRHLEGATTG